MPSGVFESGIQTTSASVHCTRRPDSDDPDDIAQVVRCLELDSLLFGPRHIMRPKQPLHLDEKLHPRTRVRREQLLPECDVQHTTQNPQFLMDRCWFKPVFLDDSRRGSELNPRSKPPSEVCSMSSVADRPSTKRGFKVQGRALIRLMGLLCADGRFGIVLKKLSTQSENRSCSPFRTISRSLSSLA